MGSFPRSWVEPVLHWESTSEFHPRPFDPVHGSCWPGGSATMKMSKLIGITWLTTLALTMLNANNNNSAKIINRLTLKRKSPKQTTLIGQINDQPPRRSSRTRPSSTEAGCNRSCSSRQASKPAPPGSMSPTVEDAFEATRARQSNGRITNLVYYFLIIYFVNKEVKGQPNKQKYA